MVLVVVQCCALLKQYAGFDSTKLEEEGRPMQSARLPKLNNFELDICQFSVQLICSACQRMNM